MQEMTLIERFANPEIIKTMPLGEKMLASMYVTFLGMAITFVALILLWGLTALMSRMLKSKEEKEKKPMAPAPVVLAEAGPAAEERADETLIAVIGAAIAASLDTSIHNIVVRSIRRVPDNTPAWGHMGRLEQMKTRVQ